jgi:hypothetical protein
MEGKPGKPRPGRGGGSDGLRGHRSLGFGAKLDAEGGATGITFPRSLTTWRAGVSAHRRDAGGDATAAITTKNLLVRLQSPRFFVER